MWAYANIPQSVLSNSGAIMPKWIVHRRNYIGAVLFLLLMLVSLPCRSSADKHYQISIGEREPDGEVVGEKCTRDKLCQIKLRLASGVVVTMNSQVVDGRLTLIFKSAGKYLYASSVSKTSDNKFFQMSIPDKATQQSDVYLFVRKPENDEAMVLNRPNLVAKLNIKVRY